YPRNLPAEMLKKTKKHGYGFPEANGSSSRHSSFLSLCSSSVRGNFRCKLREPIYSGSQMI
ncbi:MAG TPA: hypothetical protein V6C95_02800, partial [Coleofasciculaceae cyanobacterium]